MRQRRWRPGDHLSQAIGQAVRALGARRIALVSPYSAEVIERAKHYYESKHGLHVVALEGFARDRCLHDRQAGRRERTRRVRQDRPAGDRDPGSARWQLSDDGAYRHGSRSSVSP